MSKPISNVDLDRRVTRWGRIVGEVTEAEVESMAARIRKDATEIAALRALAEEASVWKDKAIRLEAENRTMREALEPFAKEGRIFTGTGMFAHINDFDGCSMPVGDLRRAHRALNPSPSDV